MSYKLSYYFCCLICIVSSLYVVHSFQKLKPAYICKLNAVTSDIDYGLPPKLKKYADDLKNVNDDRLRYQQLLFLASKCEKLDPALKTDENKVAGCLSTVHVHATTTDGKISYKGDSDAQLTKGLVALLVNGLSGCTNEEIQRRPKSLNLKIDDALKSDFLQTKSSFVAAGPPVLKMKKFKK